MNLAVILSTVKMNRRKQQCEMTFPHRCWSQCMSSWIWRCVNC